MALGDADRADIVAEGWDYYSWETAVGVEKLKTHLGVSYPAGSLSLGQVVFKPEALRVSQVSGSLGGQASGPVLSATSDRHVVTISLDASQQSEVKAGDAVTRHAARRRDHPRRDLLGRHGGDHRNRVGRGHDHDDPGAGEAH